MSGLAPEQAVDRLDELHTLACDALRGALARFTASGVPPTPEERAAFRYPELRVQWQPAGAVPFTWRSWAKFQSPGLYCTTITQPAFPAAALACSGVHGSPTESCHMIRRSPS